MIRKSKGLISTEGKTDEQVTREIIEIMRSRGIKWIEVVGDADPSIHCSWEPLQNYDPETPP